MEVSKRVPDITLRDLAKDSAIAVTHAAVVRGTDEAVVLAHMQAVRMIHLGAFLGSTTFRKMTDIYIYIYMNV